MAQGEPCRGWAERNQAQLQVCQDMLHAVEKGKVTKEEYDQHKRKLILALSKPVAGSHHIASAPARLALLTELKNSGCILEIEYQWARVPILCQIDLVKRPRKENREPPEHRFATPTPLGLPHKGDQRAQGVRVPRNSGSSSPLGPSKNGANIEAASQHPLAPGTKEAFLLRQAASSGDDSQHSKGRPLKRRPSFAGLGQARRSASFSAGDSGPSDTSNRKPAPQRSDLRSSLSCTSSPLPRKGFGRSLSFSNGQPEEAYKSLSLKRQDAHDEGQDYLRGSPLTQSVDMGLPPLARSRRPSLLEAATGLVRKSRQGAFASSISWTDSEAGPRFTHSHVNEAGVKADRDDTRGRVVESEPETWTSQADVSLDCSISDELDMRAKGSGCSKYEARQMAQDRVRLDQSRPRQGSCKERAKGSGRQGGHLEALTDFAETRQRWTIQRLPRGPLLAAESESVEASGQQSQTTEEETKWIENDKLTRKTKEHRTGAFHKLKVHSETFHSAESGFESTGGSHDEVPRVKKRTVGKVAQKLMGSGHVLLRDWNRKLVGLVRDKPVGRSVSASEDEGPRGGGWHSGEGQLSRQQKLRRRVYHVLDTWRHEACGRQSPKHFLADAQMTRLAEVLPQTIDDLRPLLPQPWIDRYGPYVLRIVHDVLDTAQLPADERARVTSATSAGSPQRPPPPLPQSSSAVTDTSGTDCSMTSHSDAQAKRHGTWARRKRVDLEVQATCLPKMTEESDGDLDVFSPGTGPLPRERLGNPRAGHASRREYLRKSQEKALRRSLDNPSRTKAGESTQNAI